MAWRYCACGAGLVKPDIRTDLIGGQECLVCGDHQDRAQSVEEWLIELSKRLDEIEAGKETE
jgi:hypothetical protein